MIEVASRRRSQPAPPVSTAGVSRTAERTVATLEQVDALAAAVPPRYRMLILLAAWSGARWGELVALSRDSVDLDVGTLTIDRQYVELRDGRLVRDTPKTAAGVRTVHIPPHLLLDLQQYIDRYTTAASTVIFPNSKDQPIRRAGAVRCRRCALARMRDEAICPSKNLPRDMVTPILLGRGRL